MRAFLAIALVAAAVSALPQDGWRRVGGALPTDLVDFTVTLRWQNEQHLDAAHRGEFSNEARQIMLARETAAPGHDSITAALGGWKKLLTPAQADFATVEDAFRATGHDIHRYCTRRWDAFECERVPVSAASEILGATFARYQHRGLQTRNGIRVLTAAQPTELALYRRLAPAVVAVNGASLFDVDQLLKARDTQRSPNRLFDETAKPTAAEMATATGGQAPPKWPAGANGEPVLLNVMSLGSNKAGVFLGLTCKNGNKVSANAVNQGCASAEGVPAKVEIKYGPAGGAMQTQTFGAFATCQSPASLGGQTLCQHLLQGLTAWTNYNVSARTQFGDNSWSPYAAMLAWNGTSGQFVSPSIRSTTASFFMEQQANAQDLLTTYNVPASALPASGAWETSNVTQGVIELSGIANGAFNMLDLDLYMAGNHISSYSSKMVQKIGPDETEAAGEATLDIEVMMGVAQGPATVFYSQVAGDSLNGWIVKWLQKLTWGTPATFAKHPPSVWSCSYGAPEHDGSGVNVPIAERYFKLLSGSGVTFLTASGDSGAWGGQRSYPATSMHNLAVGATSNTKAFAPLSAASPQVCSAINNDLITSSGGFSHLFNASRYQQSFLPTGETMRGLPDVAAIGSYINIVVGLQSQPVWGTSASSPITAGLITLANHARAKAGKPTIAYANQMIYAASSSTFDDVTQGSNCYGRSVGLSLGFAAWQQCWEATNGWDAATGRGQLNYPAFERFAVSWANPPPPPPMPSPPSMGGVLQRQ